MRRVAAAALLGLLAVVPARAADPCTVPAELIHDDPKLPALAAKLNSGGPVKVVAIGGGSTAGAAAGSPQRAYPQRLQEILAQRWPKASITVVNKGVQRQTAQEMIDRFPRDVFPENPTLVIWETGTTDAVRGIDVEEFAETLKSGISQLHDHEIGVMLVDMQFSRATSSVINFERYLDALRRTADVNDVFVFRRYDIMKYWSENGVFNFDDMPRGGSERAELATRVYECIARRLAEAIEYSTQ